MLEKNKLDKRPFRLNSENDKIFRELSAISVLCPEKSEEFLGISKKFEKLTND